MSRGRLLTDGSASPAAIDRCDSASSKLQDGLRGGLSLALRAYLSVYHRLDIVHKDRLPAAGPFLMISNHASHLDAICLRAALPTHRLASAFTAVAEDYFHTSLFRQLSARWFANAVPISRQLHIRGGLRRCRSVLTGDDGILILFPEGTRSRDGKLGAFRPGVGALLAGSNLPVVPCAIQGSFNAWPRGDRFAKPQPVRVLIGHPRRYENLPRTRQSHRDIARDLQSSVEALLWQ